MAEPVGREKELEELERVVAATAGGEARAVALVGEAGIGKSTLLGALARRAEAAGMTVLRGAGSEVMTEVPFGVAAEALDERAGALHARRVESLGADAELAAVLPSLGETRPARPAPPGGAAERFRYHRALRGLLELLARERPVALLLDDLHWADEASLELVEHLLRRPPAGAFLLALGMRQVAPAAELLGALRGGVVLTLAPLGEEAARSLLAGVADEGVRERFLREAGGNPLYLEELARTADAPGRLPGTLLAAVTRELAGLPAAARRLLDGAAVVGDPWDPELASRAVGLDPGDAPEAIDVLVARGVVHPGAGPREFGFRHPLFRRAVYDAAPAGGRLLAHERVAAALAERGAPAVARAHHLERCAAPGDREAASVLAAAADASAVASPLTAARWYGAALGLLPDDDPGRAALLTARAEVFDVAGRTEEAREAYLGAIELAPPAERLDLVLACADVEHRLGHGEEAGTRLRQELATRGADDLHARTLLEHALAMNAFLAGDLAGAGARAAAVMESAVGREPAVEVGAAGLHAHALHNLGRTSEAQGPLARAEAVAASVGDAAFDGRSEGLLLVGATQVMLDRYRDAELTMRRAADVARGSRRGTHLTWVLSGHALALYMLAEADACVAVAEAAEESGRLARQEAHIPHAMVRRAMALRMRGEPAAALQAAAEVRERVASMPPTMVSRTQLAHLLVLEAEDDPERLLRGLADVAGAEYELVEPGTSTSLALAAVRAALALGRPDEAARLARLAAARAQRLALPTSRVRAGCAEAELLLARGEAAAAARVAGEALEEAHERDTPLDGLAAGVLAGRARAAAGSRDAAVATLRAVVSAAERSGALRFRDDARRELRQLGTRLPAEPARGTGGLDELSAREREIATLVAAGRMNKQIASALSLSEKTIEANLSRIYAKVGVRSRAELAAQMARER